jgi:hypothetical protein
LKPEDKLNDSNLLVLAKMWHSDPRLNGILLPLVKERPDPSFDLALFLAGLCRAECIPQSFTREITIKFSELSSTKSRRGGYWGSAKKSSRCGYNYLLVPLA